MRGLHWNGRVLELSTELAEPRADEDHVVVAIHKAGICRTDLEIVRGYRGFTGVLGHELVGHVERGPAELIGRRVVADINVPCGVCSRCARGDELHCARDEALGIAGHDGALAERVRIRRDRLVFVPDDVSDDAAVFAEPLAAAYSVLDCAEPKPGLAIVVGGGKLGVLAAQVLQRAGWNTHVVARYEAQRTLASRLGLVTTDADDAPRDADLVVDTSGSSSGLTLALTLVRPRGTVVKKSTIAHAQSVDLNPLVVREVRLVGSRCGSITRAVQGLAAREIQVLPLITERYPLSQALVAFERARGAAQYKVLVEMGP